MNSNHTVRDIKKTMLTDQGDHLGHVFHWPLEKVGIEHIYIYHRQKGEKNWGHFHKGENSSRNPERLYMVQGKMKMWFEDLDGGKLELIIEQGEILITPKLIWHQYEILEDAVFIEPRIKTEQELPDTFNLEEFKKFKSSK